MIKCLKGVNLQKIYSNFRDISEFSDGLTHAQRNPAWNDLQK